MRIETKIILGTAFFFGIILLVGWVALNEEARMTEFTMQFESRSIERGATLFEANCSTCHGPYGQGSGRAPALNNPALFNGARLDEVNWAGGLYDYVENAISAGRPNSGAYWPESMPTWGQGYGGPLRDDQVQDLTRFVMNWENAALDEENPPEVVQDFIVPGIREEGDLEIMSSGQPVGSSVVAEELPQGDSVRGEALYTSNELGCSSCHAGGLIAPPTEGSFSRAEERVATVAELEGYTPEQYLAESILMPNAYLVPNESGKIYHTGG
ncbi:MAG: c-type cytochrome, partial [Anaerolineae bacterium]|nr:c-type cytochrome [Anaerolineae bacterium]